MRFIIWLFATMLLSGCQGSYTEMQYGATVVTSPTADGKFHNLRFDEWRASGSRAGLPKIYVKVDDHAPFFLPDVDVESAAKFLSKPSRHQTQLPNGDKQEFVSYSSRTVILNFVNDMPTYVAIGDYTQREYDGGIKIGPDADGPFFEFPLTRAEVIKVFGPPDQEVTQRHRPPT